jgi:copper(I)-binding protein
MFSACKNPKMELLMTRPTRFAALLSLAVLPLPAAAAPAADGIKDAWVRINPAPGRPAAGYFRFTNGTKPDRLVEARAEGARVELHTMSMADGVMRMQKLDGLEIAAGETVTFAPGGKHLMLFGLEKPPAAVPITLVFASGARITTNAEVRKAAPAAPSPHSQH